ncbi:MAG TPA: regulatory protein RecX [Thermodesulfobacteriota bacterium]|nr:regulatory protein RecX [Deltaproteobacteria bacterium]HNR12434.1 regulatory protein RecX [Thermodesulfobacteriota bacterium]HNU70190.1 regulatory protein RecX [Thermodesulfobacteriota bacterium]HOC38892.1 regulatory protein RecX [Thermodesulfobacteriota bacterium]HQO77440.1 regulatory protein RecX [Thermodesulfobacteriota bacterium]
MSQEDDGYKARQKAFRLLALRSRSKQEIRDKLTEKGFASPVVEQTISDLAGYGYLNDRSFARQLAHSLFTTRSWGFRRIAFAIRSRGIPDDILEEAIAELRHAHSEEESAADLIKRRFSGIDFKTASLPEKQRVINFLQRRGFSWETIHNVTKT